MLRHIPNQFIPNQLGAGTRNVTHAHLRWCESTLPFLPLLEAFLNSGHDDHDHEHHRSWASSVFRPFLFSHPCYSCLVFKHPNPFHCSQVRQWLQHTSLLIPVAFCWLAYMDSHSIKPFRAPYSSVSYDPLHNSNNQSILHSSFGWVSKFGNPPSPSTSG